MNIGVCVKIVPDYEIPADKFQLKDGRITGEYNELIGLYDEHAVEVALQLRSKGEDKVYIISYGREDQMPALRKALSMGADEVILIKASTDDPFVTASNLANVVKKYGIDAVILGRVSSDLEREMVPPILAGILNRPYLPYTMSISKTENGSFLCEQQLDDRNLVLKVNDNFVVSVTDAPCNLPRIPNLKEIMRSKKKPVHFEEEIPTDKFEWAEEASVSIPHYEYVNEMLPNDDLSATAKLLLDKLREEHYL